MVRALKPDERPNPLEDIDGAVILRLLPQKIEAAMELVADSAITLDALMHNPDAHPDEIEGVRKVYAARRFQLDYLKSEYAQRKEATE